MSLSKGLALIGFCVFFGSTESLLEMKACADIDVFILRQIMQVFLLGN